MDWNHWFCIPPLPPIRPFKMGPFSFLKLFSFFVFICLSCFHFCCIYVASVIAKTRVFLFVFQTLRRYSVLKWVNCWCYIYVCIVCIVVVREAEVEVMFCLSQRDFPLMQTGKKSTTCHISCLSDPASAETVVSHCQVKFHCLVDYK